MVCNGGDESGNMGGGMMSSGTNEARRVEMECWEWCAGDVFGAIAGMVGIANVGV